MIEVETQTAQTAQVVRGWCDGECQDFTPGAPLGHADPRGRECEGRMCVQCQRCQDCQAEVP